MSSVIRHRIRHLWPCDSCVICYIIHVIRAVCSELRYCVSTLNTNRSNYRFLSCVILDLEVMVLCVCYCVDPVSAICLPRCILRRSLTVAICRYRSIGVAAIGFVTPGNTAISLASDRALIDMYCDMWKSCHDRLFASFNSLHSVYACIMVSVILEITH